MCIGNTPAAGEISRKECSPPLAAGAYHFFNGGCADEQDIPSR